MYGLCDCNNFFVSCERVFRPDLASRPVVVLSNNDGCIIARSNEAKALGIGMGQPFYQVQQLIARAQVAVFSANHTLYGDMSRRVMETLRTLVPDTEIYSIDEAFFDLHGVAEPLDEYGRRIGRTIRRNTGIPVSIGIAPTKTLAKIASKLAKRYPRLDGCCYMYRKQDIEKVLTTFRCATSGASAAATAKCSTAWVSERPCNSCNCPGSGYMPGWALRGSACGTSCRA